MMSVCLRAGNLAGRASGRYAATLAACWISLLCFVAAATAGNLPEGFVCLDEYVSGVVVELRYSASDNFVGEPVDGYESSRCILTREAAQALKQVQTELKKFGLGLKIFDAYRPQRAVDHFVRWAKDLSDTRMKSKYYPDVPKKNLFSEGYIADKSSHSRGSTVDLTLVETTPGQSSRELDMGSGFDFFSPLSWPSSLSVGGAQRAHRMLLQKVMMSHGFVPYEQEWWHFTLKHEPYPDTYFDFLIR